MSHMIAAPSFVIAVELPHLEGAVIRYLVGRRVPLTVATVAASLAVVDRSDETVYLTEADVRRYVDLAIQ